MQDFAYRARGPGGTTEGVISAGSVGEAADKVRALGVVPLAVRPAEITRTSLFLTLRDSVTRVFKEKVTVTDQLLFSQQLHTLLSAGVPILRALHGLQETASPALAKVLLQVRESLESGHELSMSMARQPGVFSTFYLSMVRIGEETGRLDEVFLRLYDHLAFDKFMREQVKSALRYPSFVVAAMGVALLIINIFVIPAFAQVFKGFNADLPLMTRVLLGFSDFVRTQGWLLGLASVGGWLGFRNWSRGAGRLVWDRYKLRLPIAGKIIRKALLARFSRGVSMALHSGVPVVQALQTIVPSLENAYLEAAVEKMQDGVQRGESILRTAAASGIFTPTVLQMIAVGEETGTLDNMLDRVANMYRNEVEYELKTLSQQIEPILIVSLGAVVLVLALGVFLPMWDLGKVALHK